MILSSPRLLLRPLQQSDVDLVLELFTDPAMMKYAGGPQEGGKIRDEMEIYIRRGGDGSIGVWCVCKRDSEAAIGSIALLPLPIEVDDTEWETVRMGEVPDGDIEIGYFLRKNEWGQGYVSEAVSCLLDFAFTVSEHQGIVAVIDPRNTASRRVLERAGFLGTGDRRAYRETCPGFRITKSDWLALTAKSGLR